MRSHLIVNITPSFTRKINLVGTMSVHFERKIIGMSKKSENKKASKQSALKLFEWAQMDLNHRPADYESAALTN